MPTLQLRQATVDDVPEVHALADRTYRHHYGRPHSMPVDFLVTAYSMPGRDHQRDFPAVVLDDRIVGSAALWARPPFTELTSFPNVDPGLEPALHREVTLLLVGALEDAARHKVDGLGDSERLLVIVVARPDTQVREALGDGWQLLRSTHEMVVQLGDEAPSPAWPDGITTTVVDASRSEDAAVVLAEAFADHHGDMVWDLEAVQHLLEGESERLDLSRLAYDDSGPVGIVLCEDVTDGGYVGGLAVVRRARGSGLGLALLQSAFAAFHGEGTRRVGLHVDADSLTGATRLYGRAGMSVRTVDDMWARPLPASA